MGGGDRGLSSVLTDCPGMWHCVYCAPNQAAAPAAVFMNLHYIRTPSRTAVNIALPRGPRDVLQRTTVRTLGDSRVLASTVFQ